MSMGDLANGHACNAFITAFAEDIIKKYRSPLLDQTFGEKVRYYVMADDNWEVHLYAAVASGADSEEKFQLAGAPIFCPTSDDIIEQTAEALELDEDEVERRLEKAAEDDARESEQAWQETLKNASPNYSVKRIGSAHGEDVLGGRARCAICGWIDEADPTNPTVREWHGDSFGNEDVDINDMASEPTVMCKLCQKQVPARTAHRHDGGYVGDECWDERLRSTE
jgi:peroxiredoxin family protein